MLERYKLFSELLSPVCTGKQAHDCISDACLTSLGKKYAGLGQSTWKLKPEHKEGQHPHKAPVCVRGSCVEHSATAKQSPTIGTVSLYFRGGLF